MNRYSPLLPNFLPWKPQFNLHFSLHDIREICKFNLQINLMEYINHIWVPSRSLNGNGVLLKNNLKTTEVKQSHSFLNSQFIVPYWTFHLRSCTKFSVKQEFLDMPQTRTAQFFDPWPHNSCSHKDTSVLPTFTTECCKAGNVGGTASIPEVMYSPHTLMTVSGVFIQPSEEVLGSQCHLS